MGKLRAAAVCAALALGLGGCAHLGDAHRRVTVGGLERSYSLHVPEVTPDGPLPLVLVFHGAGGNARAMEQKTAFSAEADARGFAVAYPDADTGPRYAVWNAGVCCGYASEQGIDDVRFARAVVEDVAARVAIDRARVFAAGHSNGGMLAYRLACEASDLFAAVGVVAGALVTSNCAPSHPVSVLHVHGTFDGTVPMNGGAGAIRPRGFTYPPTESAIAFWQEADGCDATPRISNPAEGVTVRSYSDCRAGTAVELVLIAGARHSWPSDPQQLEATSALWEFFASHPRR